MSAYIVAQITVTSPTQYEEYKKLVPASIAKHGGRYLTRGGLTETLEGTWAPTRIVVLEFPTVEQAKAWYASPEYDRARAARAGAADMQMLVIEGAPPI